jgi:hypothetical protein
MTRTTVAWWLAAILAVATVVAVDRRPPPPCQAEDGGPYPCVWDGPHRGNHQGDYVIIRSQP